jgi:hypothetical protein
MAVVGGFDWSAFAASLKKQRAASKAKGKKKTGTGKGGKGKQKPIGGGSL